MKKKKQQQQQQQQQLKNHRQQQQKNLQVQHSNVPIGVNLKMVHIYHLVKHLSTINVHYVNV